MFPRGMCLSFVLVCAVARTLDSTHDHALVRTSCSEGDCADEQWREERR